MKLIVYPGKRTDEFLFHEECTVQDVRKRITELLQFTGSRCPNPHNFRVWLIHPRRELSKPLRTLRQMQMPRECVVLAMPPDVIPPPLSNLDELDRILSAFNFTHKQTPSNNYASNHNGNQTNSKEKSTKEKRTRKSKTTKKIEPTDEPFLEIKQYSCKICFKSFGSTGAVRTHLTRIHKMSKNAKEKARRTVQPVKAVRREQARKKAKENKNISVNITVTNTVNYNYG